MHFHVNNEIIKVYKRESGVADDNTVNSISSKTKYQTTKNTDTIANKTINVNYSDKL